MREHLNQFHKKGMRQHPNQTRKPGVTQAMIARSKRVLGGDVEIEHRPDGSVLVRQRLDVKPEVKAKPPTLSETDQKAVKDWDEALKK